MLGGDRLIEEGSANLKTLAEKIDTDKMKQPSFLMVLTGTGNYAYRRPDGVYVVPLGCLERLSTNERPVLTGRSLHIVSKGYIACNQKAASQIQLDRFPTCFHR